MAQAGLNNEKNWRSKISLDCPFKTLETRHRGRKNQFDGFFYIKASCVEDTEELVILIGYAVCMDTRRLWRSNVLLYYDNFLIKGQLHKI